ncbi:hypothetical protein SCHPADRAFT_947175 [Schizopora paradoxa]|uniref:Uncharacterized protein n=1 Tax=Schizopora paradoxa TaxID=27342 RepID=A0A0H2R091_9AGAM|nr:hypothetical protein SCHPADRAFT_947175 [Schizopora paradoxa]
MPAKTTKTAPPASRVKANQPSHDAPAPNTRGHAAGARNAAPDSSPSADKGTKGARTTKASKK